MTPRTAGVLAIGGAVAIAVLGTFLLMSPPWSIPGALVLVGASILLSVGTVWLYRRSWAEPWPPDVTPSLQKRLRRLQVMQIVNSVLFVAAIASAVSCTIGQNWWQLIYALFLALMALSNRSLNRRTLRHLREAQSEDEAP